MLGKFRVEKATKDCIFQTLGGIKICQRKDIFQNIIWK